MHQETILIVDDKKSGRENLKQIFQEKFRLLEAETFKQAIKLLLEYQTEITLVLLDISDESLDRLEVLRAMASMDLLEYIPVILIADRESLMAEKLSYDLGATDIIWKPFDSYVVSCRVQNMMELYQHKNHLEYLLFEQTKKIESQAKKLRENSNVIIDVLSNIVEFRDMESGGHINRVRKYTEILAKELARIYPEYGLTREHINLITSASVMHDIGKISIPDTILLKPGRLTEEEFEIMKTHPVRGCEIIETLGQIQDVEYYQYCYHICRSHHERYDGNGYPDGLTGEEIPIAAQIVSLADVYDALVSRRVNKAAFDKEKAYQMILSGECGVFSPKILQCFLAIRHELEALV